MSENVLDIEVWFGAGDGHIIGPIEATLVEMHANLNDVRFLITDKGWLGHVGWDEPVEFTYPHLRSDHYVGYDAYAWCAKGEGPQSPTKWW
jgi:hypothetical protein